MFRCAKIALTNRRACEPAFLFELWGEDGFALPVQRQRDSTRLLCEEPFRVFFPAGMLLGVVGVSLWIFYYSDSLTNYPGTTHARLMVEGFMASFIIGFLGTAGPRITSTPPFSRLEFLALLGLDLLAAGLHFGGSHRLGDTVFALCLVTFVIVIGKRFARRKDSPPPNFALVGLGLLNGLVGAVLIAAREDEAYSGSYRLGLLFLEQGFVLLPILGVAPFLLPRLLGNPAADEIPESRWLSSAVFAAMVALTIDISFVLETFAEFQLGNSLRLAAVLFFFVALMPLRGRSFLGDCLRCGMVALIAGFAAQAIWPAYRIGAMHIVFISGFSFVVLTVATRVVFGHSGNAHFFSRRLPFFIVVAALLFVAMLSRYVADLAANARGIHLIAAAGFWVAAAIIWSVKVLPKVRLADPAQ